MVLGVGVLALLLLGWIAARRAKFLPMVRSPHPELGVMDAPPAKIAPRSSSPVETTVPPPRDKPVDPVKAAPKAGRILGTVILPENVVKFNYRIYVFNTDGRSEANERFQNQSSFVIEQLAPGLKGVIFFSVDGAFGSTYQMVTVPEGGEGRVDLRPNATSLLKGTVVDSKGEPVVGVLVAVTEQLAVGVELFSGGRPKHLSAVGRIGSSSSVSSTNPGVVTQRLTDYVSIDPGQNSIVRGLPTDKDGRFNLPVSSTGTPVSIKVFRELGQTLKEENVVPGPNPVRIILPNE